MKSGLYACAGASATASAAACAKRFDDPITNESNVYLALKPPLSGRLGINRWTGAATPALVSAAGARVSTWSSISRPAPVTSRTAAAISSRKCPSIQLRVKSFGTARTKRSSSRATPPVCANQVPYVVSLRALLSRPETSLHKLSAVSSICPSTPVASSSLVNRRRRAYQRPESRQTSGICRYLQSAHNPSTCVESDGGNSAEAHRWAASPCGKRGGRSSVRSRLYCALGPPQKGD